MLTPALRSKIDALWDKFWSGGIANPLTAVEQISYLLFMRRLDAVDQKRKEDAEWLKRDYKSTVDPRLNYEQSMEVAMRIAGLHKGNGRKRSSR